MGVGGSGRTVQGQWTFLLPLTLGRLRTCKDDGQERVVGSKRREGVIDYRIIRILTG